MSWAAAFSTSSISKSFLRRALGSMPKLLLTVLLTTRSGRGGWGLGSLRGAHAAGAAAGLLDLALQVVLVLREHHRVVEVDDVGHVQLVEVVVEQDHALVGAGLDGRIDAEALVLADQ